MAFFRKRKTPFFILLGLAALAALTHTLWLGALGAYLVHADSPAQADYAVVLAGDSFGHRVLEGGDLVRRGFVRKALVSGPVGCYGHSESDMAVDFAVQKGYPENYFIKVPHKATSTRTEADVLIPFLRQLGAHSFLLVTSDYHTRRAGRYFRPRAAGLDMRVIAAPDEHYRWNSWWRYREAKKIFYIEWSKTIASLFGM